MMFQACHSPFPWPKVFSPTVIIRDGKGCHESVPQSAVFPAQQEQTVCDDYARTSPVLLDLSKSARNREDGEPSVANRSTTSGGAGKCNACRPHDHRCEMEHRADCVCKMRFHPSPELATKTFSTRAQRYQQSGLLSGQGLANENVPQPCHKTLSEIPSEWRRNRGAVADYVMSCSGPWVPVQALQSHVAYWNDLQRLALSWFSPDIRTMKSEMTSSIHIPNISVLEVPHDICSSDATSAVTNDQPSCSDGTVHTDVNCRQSWSSNGKPQTAGSDCQHSEHVRQETGYLQMTQVLPKTESVACDSDYLVVHPQCSCVSPRHDEELISKKNDRSHANNSITNDVSYTSGKSDDSCFQKIPIKNEECGDLPDRPNIDDSCSRHGVVFRRNLSPAPDERSETHKDQPHVACPENASATESLQAEFSSPCFRYHGIWTLTKAMPTDPESLVSVVTDRSRLGSDFRLDNFDYIRPNSGLNEESVDDYFQCKGREYSVYQSNLGPRNAHERPHRPQDRMCNRYTSDTYAQGKADNEEPYDLSTKNYKGRTLEKYENIPVSQRESCGPHIASPEVCAAGTENTQPAVSPVMMLANSPALSFQSAVNEKAAGMHWTQQAPGQSCTDSSAADLRGCQTSSPTQDAQHSAHHLAWPSEQGQHGNLAERWNRDDSSTSLMTVCCESKSLTDRQSPVVLFDLKPAPCCIRPGHPHSKNTDPPFLASTPASTLTSCFEQDSPQHPAAMVTGPTSTYLYDSADTDTTGSLSFRISTDTKSPLSCSLPSRQKGPLTGSLASTISTDTKGPLTSRSVSPTVASADLQTETQRDSPADQSVPWDSPADQSAPWDSPADQSVPWRQVSVSAASRHARHTAASAAAVDIQVSEHHVRAGSSGGGGKKKRTRQRKFQCHLCAVTCSNRGQLRGHLRTHTGERPFLCREPGCNKTFVRNEELTRHRRIHSGERPYACSLCGKAFMRKDHLNKHLRMHSVGVDDDDNNDVNSKSTSAADHAEIMDLE